MKNSLVLLLVLMFSSHLSADKIQWDKTHIKNQTGEYYLDSSGVHYWEGFIYYWVMFNRFEKSPDLTSASSRRFVQGDCESFREKTLSFHTHSEFMAEGTDVHLNLAWQDFRSESADSNRGKILRLACIYAKKR